MSLQCVVKVKQNVTELMLVLVQLGLQRPLFKL